MLFLSLFVANIVTLVAKCHDIFWVSLPAVTSCVRKLEKAVAVWKTMLEGFLRLLGGKTLPEFPATRNAIPIKVWAFPVSPTYGLSALDIFLFEGVSLSLITPCDGFLFPWHLF